MKKAKKRMQRIKIRNAHAVHAFMRSGAGQHGDNNKQSSRDACRNFRF